MAAESTIVRVRMSLVEIGAFGAAGYVKRHPERAREKLIELRQWLVDHGDDRVKNVDRVVRMLDRDGARVGAK